MNTEFQDLPNVVSPKAVSYTHLRIFGHLINHIAVEYTAGSRPHRVAAFQTAHNALHLSLIHISTSLRSLCRT